MQGLVGLETGGPFTIHDTCISACAASMPTPVRGPVTTARSDPLPAKRGLTPNTKGEGGSKEKKNLDIMVEQCHASSPTPRPAGWGFCDDASSSRSEKGGKPIPPALLLSLISSSLSGMVDCLFSVGGVGDVGWPRLRSQTCQTTTTTITQSYGSLLINLWTRSHRGQGTNESTDESTKCG